MNEAVPEISRMILTALPKLARKVENRAIKDSTRRVVVDPVNKVATLPTIPRKLAKPAARVASTDLSKRSPARPAGLLFYSGSVGLRRKIKRNVFHGRSLAT